MKKNVIVSLADANYFPLLDELVDSIKRFKQSEDVAICILDAGLKQDQRDSLSKKVDEIKNAEWDIEVPGYKVKGKEWLKSQVSRAFLPKYFPNYEKYLWIDCDAWVNDWSCVELYFKACDDGKLGITQTIGPGYKITSKVNWLFGKLALIKSQNFKHAVKSKISYADARKLAFAPHINIGVFSLEKDSKGWSTWQNNLEKTVLHHDKDGDFFILPAHSYGLGVALEKMKVPENITVICIGKSTYARLGIIVNTTPAEAGWEGHLTLEFSNSSGADCRIYAEEGICQLLFFEGDPCSTTYEDRRGKYQNQPEKVTLAKI